MAFSGNLHSKKYNVYAFLNNTGINSMDHNVNSNRFTDMDIKYLLVPLKFIVCIDIIFTWGD